MYTPSLPWSALLAASLSFLPAGQTTDWDPSFDYTNLPPASETLWASMKSAAVTMEAAWELIEQGEGANVHLSKAELKPSAEGDYWAFEVFVSTGAEDPKPKRLNLRVATAEPKITKRVELLTLAPDEVALWEVLRKAKVEIPIAIQLSKDHSGSAKPETALQDPRIRTARFVATPENPYWRLEMMGVDARSDVIRRFETEINAKEPRMRRKLMLDRFAGEPLRKDQPIELPNGMFLCDMTVGDGQEITAESKVRVNYRLFLLDNKKLHDTWQSKRTEEFLVTQAPLKGMSEGMVGMRVGGKRKIAIPYPLAFGEQGNQIAPPKAMVICDVAVEELVGP